MSRIRVAGPDRYQIDHARQPQHGPVAIACDGQRRWQVYPDKITTGSAERFPDPSAIWLTRPGCSAAGYPPATPTPSLMFPAAAAIIDAGTRLVLRLTSYMGAITTDIGDFHVDLPANRPTVEEPRT